MPNSVTVLLRTGSRLLSTESHDTDIFNLIRCDYLIDINSDGIALIFMSGTCDEYEFVWYRQAVLSIQT